MCWEGQQFVMLRTNREIRPVLIFVFVLLKCRKSLYEDCSDSTEKDFTWQTADFHCFLHECRHVIKGLKGMLNSCLTLIFFRCTNFSCTCAGGNILVVSLLLQCYFKIFYAILRWSIKKKITRVLSLFFLSPDS